MKKLYKFFFIVLIFNMFFPLQFLQSKQQFCAETPKNEYARINSSSAFLYKTSALQDSFEGKFFSLPETYFVRILAYEQENALKAEYMGIIGYVKKTDLSFVEGKPISPFASNLSFRVFAQNGLNLRSTPKESDGIANRITTVPFLENNLEFIGKAEGEEAVSHRGSTWIFCCYIKGETRANGYLYGGYLDMLPEIQKNTEELKVIDPPVFEEIVTKPEDNGFSKITSLSKEAQAIIISAVSLPALFIIYLLFKPTRLLAQGAKSEAKETKEAKEEKKPKKRRRKSDYYEYDD